MKAPIIIVESYDISVHPTVNHAERQLEVRDVKDNIYTAYDSEGQLLNLFVDLIERKRSFLWLKWKSQYESVRIKEFEPRRYKLNDLRTHLIDNLKSKKSLDNDLIDSSTEELVKKVGKKMPWRL